MNSMWMVIRSHPSDKKPDKTDCRKSIPAHENVRALFIVKSLKSNVESVRVDTRNLTKDTRHEFPRAPVIKHYKFQKNQYIRT